MEVESQQSTRKNKGDAKSTTQTIGDATLKGLGDLIKLLPTGTVFMFQFFSPLLTSNGHCHTVNKFLSGILLFLCSFSCCFSSFTDSYTGSDGQVYYGIVTKNGMWVFSDPNASSKDLSKYKLRFGDFVHALLSLIVFAVVALLDTNTVTCFYPSLESHENTMLMVLPTVVGGLSSFVFMLFPNNRHGIGYPATQTTDDSK